MYEIRCLSDKCQLEPSSQSSPPRPAFVYVGETARSGWERATEHVRNYRKRLEDSCLEKHASDSHKGERRPKFAMKVVKQYETAFRRQIAEAVRIRTRAREPGVTVLNSKGEYSRCELPRLVVDKDKGHSRGVGPTLPAPAPDSTEPQSKLDHSAIDSENLNILKKPFLVVNQLKSNGMQAKRFSCCFKFRSKYSQIDSYKLRLI